MFPVCLKSVPRAFHKGFKGVLALFSHKEFINEQKYVDCNAISLFKTSLILMSMSKNPVLLQKVL